MTESSVKTSNASVNNQDWDLSWYECLIKFEDKQRERTNKILLQAEEDRKTNNVPVVVEKNDEKDAPNEDEKSNPSVLIPSLVLKQMELVKQQMTEYNDLMEMLELTMGKNDKLQMEIETIRNENKGLQKKIDQKVAKKEEQIQQLSDQFSVAQEEKDKLRKKLVLSRKKEDMLKRRSEKTVEELKMLRRLNQAFAINDINSQGSDETPTSSRLSSHDALKASNPDELWKSVSKILQPVDDDSASIDSSSMESSKTRSEKKKILKLLIQNLQDEGSLINSDDYDDGSISSNSRASKYNGSGNNRSNRFFTRFLTALQEEEEEEIERNKPLPRSSV